MRNWRDLLFAPAIVTLLLSLLLIAAVILQADGDPLALARIGTRFSEGNPNGTEGYDGQFVYYIARDLSPEQVAPYLDVPAYRYQRILLPLLARLSSLGNVAALPWALAGIGLVSHAIGTQLVSALLAHFGVSRWYALVYGLWVGFLLALRLDLPEPLAYALVAGAILAMVRGRRRLGWGLYALAVFAKEVTLLFVLGQLLYDLAGRRWKDAAGLSLVVFVPFGLFQWWLWAQFGEAGIGSGGAMATPFEMVPFMGLLRVGAFSTTLLLALLLIYGLFVITPAVWGFIDGLRRWRRDGLDLVTSLVIVNAGIIPFIPFSTYREPGGMLRFICGLALAALLYAGKFQVRRALNYGFFWLALNAILLN